MNATHEDQPQAKRVKFTGPATTPRQSVQYRQIYHQQTRDWLQGLIDNPHTLRTSLPHLRERLLLSESRITAIQAELDRKP